MLHKKTNSKIVSVILISTLIFTGLTGCANTKKQDEANVSQEPATLTLTDMAGREIVVPSEINKIYSAVPIGTAMIYTINPSKLVALNYKLSELEKKYIVKENHDLPVLGNYIMGSTANEEDILNLAPDIIIYVGIINENFKAKADESQKKLGIPVAMVDGSLKNIPAAYEFLGKLLGEEDRTTKLAEYCSQTLTEAENMAKTIPEDKKTKVYYASGPNGMMTYMAGNIHSELIDIIGAQNTADSQGANSTQYSQVSTEQLLKWNPEVILTNKVESRGEEAGPVAVRTMLLENSNLSNLDAMKNQQVYEIPCAPFSWFGQPPSVARILGIKWLGNLLYPDVFKYDIEKETKEFYKLFYNYNLSEQDMSELLKNSVRNTKS